MSLASATLHLQSSEPLFTQVVAMAGNSLMLQPIPLETAEGAYREVLSLLKINPDSPPQDQARSILEVSPNVQRFAGGNLVELAGEIHRCLGFARDAE